MQKKHLWWSILFGSVVLFVAFLWPGPAADEVDLFVPLTLHSAPPDLAVANPSVNGLDIRIRGPKSVLTLLMQAAPHYRLDLSGISAGVKNIQITPEQLALPKKVTVIQIQPSYITLRAEKKISKTLPVAVRFAGGPMAGYHVSETTTIPPSIVVSGPEKILEPLSTADTKPISLDSRSESFKKEIALDLPETLHIVSGKNLVVAEITVEEKVTVQTFDGITVEGRNTSHEFSITPPIISIDVKGPEKILARLAAEKGIEVSVNLEGLEPGVYVRRAVINLPVKTTLAGVEPEIFTVTIRGRAPRTEAGGKQSGGDT